MGRDFAGTESLKTAVHVQHSASDGIEAWMKHELQLVLSGAFGLMLHGAPLMVRVCFVTRLNFAQLGGLMRETHIPSYAPDA